MKISRYFAYSGILATILGLVYLPGQAADSWKMAIRVKGVVETRLANADSWRTVIRNRLLYQPGDRIRTQADSVGRIRTSDGALVTMGPKTDISLKEFDDRTGRLVVKMEKSKGGLRATITKFLGGGRSFEVETPNAVLAARGTDYVVLYNPDGPALEQQAERPALLAGLPGVFPGLGLLAQGSGGETIAQVFEGSIDVITEGNDPQTLKEGFRATVSNGTVSITPAPPLPGGLPESLLPDKEPEELEKGTYHTYFNNDNPAGDVHSTNPILIRTDIGNTGNIEVEIQVQVSPSPLPSPNIPNTNSNAQPFPGG